MAIKNLDFFAQWVSAWNLWDKYASTKPWCLISKNVDIFSSSNSVKAAAFTSPSDVSAELVCTSEDWRFELRTNWKVFDNQINDYITDWTYQPNVVDFLTNHKIYYRNWDSASWLTVWTPKKLKVSYDKSWEWDMITVVTNKLIYVYSKKAVNRPKVHVTWNTSWLTITESTDYNWIRIEKWSLSSSATSFYVQVNVQWQVGYWLSKYWYCLFYCPSSNKITLNNLIQTRSDIKYNWEYDVVDENTSWWWASQTITVPAEVNQYSWSSNVNGNIPWDFHTVPEGSSKMSLRFDFNLSEAASSLSDSASVDIFFRSVHEYVIPLTPLDNRFIKEEKNYIAVENRDTVDIYDKKRLLYDDEWPFYYMNKATDLYPDEIVNVADMVTDEQSNIVYLFSNTKNYWRLDIFSLVAGELQTTFYHPWIEFLWAIRINNYIYITAKQRGESVLFIYNWIELVPVVKWEESDVLDMKEPYDFNGMMCNFKDSLILWSNNWKVFAYWKTFWINACSCIFQLYKYTGFSSIYARWNELYIEYTVLEEWSNVKKRVIYKRWDPDRKYLTEFELQFPIQVWSHVIEKEATDLHTSFILPSTDCKLEFWWGDNHYHYWTFRCYEWGELPTLTVWEEYKIWWATGTYKLIFLEQHWRYYTFTLEWDLPLKLARGGNIRDKDWVQVMDYDEYNHFRYIWETETHTWYIEGQKRFHNLNNKLDLLRTHSIQIMVRWVWTVDYTPELFTLDLVSTQRDRW